MYMYVYVHTHTHTLGEMEVSPSMFGRMCVCVYVCTYIHSYVCICVYMCMHPPGEMEVSPSMFGRMCRQMMQVADELMRDDKALPKETYYRGKRDPHTHLQ